MRRTMQRWHSQVLYPELGGGALLRAWLLRAWLRAAVGRGLVWVRGRRRSCAAFRPEILFATTLRSTPTIFFYRASARPRSSQMPRDKHKGERRPTKPPKKASAPEIRDPRPASFAADTTAAIHELGFPCTVAVGGGGLAVYASRRIHAGEQILVERPLVLTVSHQCRKHICAHCIADSRKSRPGGLDGAAAWTVRCDRCGTQHYCSEACAAAAAPRHSGHECQAMASAEDLRADLEDDDLDTISQAIRMLCDKAHGFAISCGPPGVLASATSHAERLVGISPSTDEARTCLSRICAATLRCLPSEVRVPSAELLDLLERHACNLYGVTGPAGEDTAGASFAGFFHLFNHSCSPNVVFDSARRVDGATAEGAAPLFALRALFDTAPDEELCISYTSSADGIARPGGIGRAAGGGRGDARSAPCQFNARPYRLPYRLTR